MEEGGGDSLDGGAGEEVEDLGHGPQACASADGACQDHIACGGFDNFMAAHLVDRVNLEQVGKFAKRISPDAFLALRVLGESHRHEAKVTLPEKVDEWLPKVYIVISNFKSFLAGTFHGASHRYLQVYIDEFVFRFNRRF